MEDSAITREHPENLRKGMWVAVTGHVDLDNPEEDQQYNPFGFGSSRRKPPNYNGAPMQIQAVSYPFICVTDGKTVEAFDLRKISVVRLTKAYAQAMVGGRKWVAKKQRLCPLCREGSATVLKEGERGDSDDT